MLTTSKLFVQLRQQPNLSVGLLFFIGMFLCSPLLADDNISAERDRAIQLGKVFTEVAKKVKPAVVYIETLSQTQVFVTDPFELFNDEFARRFFNHRVHPQPQTQLAKGMGSGFLISENGHIVTNAHVVKNAEQIMVKLANQQETRAVVVGLDEKNDVALIKIDGKDLTHLAFGDSDKLEVGEWVLAIGNPFGLAQTVTSGIVSAKERNAMGITDYEDFIQTDAAINPGNSGGPLVNLHGEVIGLNTAIFSKSGGYMGIGFSIPSNAVQQVVKQLQTHGEFTPGYFGAMVAERVDKRGVIIEQIMPNSPAQKAGLQIGDVIISVNGRAVSDRHTFNNIIGIAGADAEFDLIYERGGVSATCAVKLRATEKVKTFNDPIFGLQVRNLISTDYIERNIPLVKGVLIEDSAPQAAALGLLPGMIIVKINNQPVENFNRYREISNAVARRGFAEFLVLQNGRFRQIQIRMR